jgi:uncharacterized protein (TIGR04222 family)
VIGVLHMKGPDFLLFYIAWGLGVFLLAWVARLVWHWAHRTVSAARWSPGIYPAEGDAYTIALLRGGPKEVAVTVLGRLMAEGYFFLEGSSLRRSKDQPDRSRLTPLEEEAFAAIAASTPGSFGIVPTAALSQVVNKLQLRLAGARSELEAAGLSPGADRRQGYQVIGFAFLLLVTGLGLAKLLMALHTGHAKVQFLVILLVMSVFAGIYLMKPPLQTVAGTRYLKWLRESHQGLVKMVSAGRRQSYGELALVAGIFGLEILPTLAPLKTALIPPLTTSGGGDSGSGCGGGGGCGGGCGGCGG